MKKIKVEIEVTYESIRRVACIVTGKVLSDEQIDILVNNAETLKVDTSVMEDETGNVDNVLATMVIATCDKNFE
jgi:NAD(P)-dependent dehydrogenase (short-subunit alcohol dehydrogenase family)